MKIPSIVYNIGLVFILFIILTPGLLLSIPASNNEDKFSPYINFTSNEVTLTSSIVHSAVFCLLYFSISSLNFFKER